MHLLLHLLYREQKEVLIDLLSKLDCLAFTTDAWTSCATQSYVSVTGHYPDELWNLRTAMIATRQVEERNTGANMAALLNGTAEEFKIKKVGFAYFTCLFKYNLKKIYFKEFAIALYRSFLSRLTMHQTWMPGL